MHSRPPLPLFAQMLGLLFGLTLLAVSLGGIAVLLFAIIAG